MTTFGELGMCAPQFLGLVLCLVILNLVARGFGHGCWLPLLEV